MYLVGYKIQWYVCVYNYIGEEELNQSDVEV